MRSTEIQLRRLIRETLLSESPTARAAAAGLALLAWSRGKTSGVIIYSPDVLFELIDNLVIDLNGETPDVTEIRKVIRDSLHETCVVRSAVSYASPPSHAPCWGAEIVQYSVSADDGLSRDGKMGPAAYDAAMWYAHAHSLAPDRSLVSTSAERVWKRYSQRAEGGDVIELPFDDLENPKTPEPADDCYVYGPSRQSLDSAYYLKSKPDGLASLEQRHSETIEKLYSDYEFDEVELESALHRLAAQLFDSQYEES